MVVLLFRALQTDKADMGMDSGVRTNSRKVESCVLTLLLLSIHQHQLCLFS